MSPLSERSTVIPKQQEEAKSSSLPADANEERLGNTSTFLGMFGTRVLVLCQSKQAIVEAGQMFLLRSQTAWRVQSWPWGFLYGSDGFQDTEKLSGQWARLCINFWSL